MAVNGEANRSKKARWSSQKNISLHCASSFISHTFLLLLACSSPKQIWRCRGCVSPIKANVCYMKRITPIGQLLFGNDRSAAAIRVKLHPQKKCITGVCKNRVCSRHCCVAPSSRMSSPTKLHISPRLHPRNSPKPSNFYFLYVTASNTAQGGEKKKKNDILRILSFGKHSLRFSKMPSLPQNKSRATLHFPNFCSQNGQVAGGGGQNKWRVKKKNDVNRNTTQHTHTPPQRRDVPRDYPIW